MIHVDEIQPSDDSSPPMYGISVVLSPPAVDDDAPLLEEETTDADDDVSQEV